jgi:hypothetical protein
MAQYGQENVKKFLEGFQLKAVKISERDEKTPDFEVFQNDQRIFFCEEKTLEYDDFEGFKNDPTYNSISSHIHKATKQFKSVNPNHDIPNVLAFTNLDTMKDIHDLFITITGKAMLEGGGLLKIRNVGRIIDDLEHIDLFLWFDREKFINFIVGKNSPFERELFELFGIVE